MTELENLTKEIPPTSLESIKQVPEIDVEKFCDLLKSTLPYYEADLFAQGMLNEGLKNSTFREQLRRSVQREIDNLPTSVSEINSINKIISNRNSKFIKTLADELFINLNMFSDDNSGKYYLLGTLLKSLYD